MNLRLLEIFRAVVQARTTTGAARALQISQPAVSGAIKQLESQLELRLFDRVGNRIVPTEEAKILFRESESISLLARALDQTAIDLKEQRRGSLKIVATPQLGHTVLPTAISELLETGSKVKVSFDVRRSFNVVEIIQSGAADVGFAIALEKELSHSLNLMPIASVEMVCLVPLDHPLAKYVVVTPADIAPYRLIGLEMGSRLSPLIFNAFRDSGVPYRTTVEVRYSETACLLARDGAGIAIVDRFSAFAQTSLHKGLTAIQFRPTIIVEASAVFSKERAPTRLSLALVEITKRLLGVGRA